MINDRYLAILDQPEISRVLFHPRPNSGDDPEAGHTVSFPVAPGISLGGRLHLASASAPVVVLFHGNGELAEDYDPLSPLFIDRGLSLLVVDYRGYGDSGGTPSASTLLVDAPAVWRQVPEMLARFGSAGNRLFVMGRSLGSTAALEVAVQAGPELAGLIIESGFATTLAAARRLGSVPAGEECDGFGNVRKIAEISVPTLIIHGAIDTLIPRSEGQMLYDRCAAADKRLLIIPNANHNNLLMVGHAAYFDAVSALIAEQPPSPLRGTDAHD